jgi:hypothetical protein
MRLLHYNSDGDFSLTEFFESNIPKYAILSHRWGAEKVTLADLTDGTGKKMAGYGKIQFCGEQARHNGLQYFWVDTYYIDKSNAVELQDVPFNSYAKQDSSSCLPNTRVDLLKEIYNWVDSEDEQCIFWLSGLAGTGKSTIARTVARRYFEQKRLGASFFLLKRWRRRWPYW